jgi:hypothetical protein
MGPVTVKIISEGLGGKNPFNKFAYIYKWAIETAKTTSFMH